MPAARIALAILTQHSKLLLQLRDFIDGIDDPGQWGLFGGHLIHGEDPERGLRRELLEELSWNAGALDFVCERLISGRSVAIFSGALDVPHTQLTLNEGSDIGLFEPSAILDGRLYSDRLRQSFEPTLITQRCLNLWLQHRTARG
jgi:8-oxo-dGTP diphosphatase